MYKISLTLKSFDLPLLKSCEKYLGFLFSFFFKRTPGIQVHPNCLKKITVCRSPHIDKKSREQFQIKVYKKTLVFTFSKKLYVLFLLELLKNLKLIGTQLEIKINYLTF